MGSLGMPARALLGALCLGALAPNTALGQQIHRNGFEGPKPFWIKSGFDAPYDETTHSITDQVWHDGKRSEYINLQAKPGTFIHYQYPVGRVPVGEEMSASLWLPGQNFTGHPMASNLSFA